MHIYSPNIGFFFSAEVARRCIWRGKLLFRTELLVTLGVSQGSLSLSFRLPEQEPLEVGGRAREGSGVWEERREGDRSLRKQLSLSWEPQGPLNFLCFPQGGKEGR